MRTLCRPALVALMLIVTPAAYADNLCDRGCLRNSLDRYLDAVFKHQPAKASLAKDSKATLNAAVLQNGEAVWQTITGYGEVQRRFIDVKSGQAVYFGELKERDVTSIVSVRIKVQAKQVAEAEWTVARKSDGSMFSLEGLASTPPPPDTPIPVAERTDRKTLIATADSYFQGLQEHDGSKVPRIPGCERVENGFKVTNRVRPPQPSAAGATPGAAEESRSGDCTAEFKGFEHSILETSHRRFPVVDEELGVVMGTTLFHRPPESAMKRNLLTEFFFQKNGKISAIYAAMYYIDPSAPDSPGW